MTALKEDLLRVFRDHRRRQTVDNMTDMERKGLKKAITLKKTLRFSVGDKCGGFVVMSRERDIHLSEQVLSDATTYEVVSVERYKRECQKLEEVIRRILGPKLERSTVEQLLPKYASVPTYYQLVKTHKLVKNANGEVVDTNSIKTRPIVASCGGPTDRISWFLQHILGPLLSHVPSHLKNVKEFLEQLRKCNFHGKPRLQYESFDVVALYTNVDTERAVEACIRLLRNHYQELQFFGLTVDNIEELLRNVVSVNIFRFKNNFYKQTRGLAMGSRLAPLLAIVFMDNLERPALSSDVLYFGRYIDDIFIVGKSRTTLRQTFGRLNKRCQSIKLTAESPSADGFLPFLNTKIKISDGQITSMWYRKPASQNILIHARSCHPVHMKTNVVHHMISTSRELTSVNSQEIEAEVDEVLRQNGYRRGAFRSWRPHRTPCGTPLVLPFITDSFARDVNRVVKRSRLPISLIFRPPPNLRQLLTSSRLYESRCERTNCNICGEHEVCQEKCVVYKVVCLACKEFYIGETSRPLHKRMDEHLRALRSPQHYTENPFSRHRTLRHPQERPPKLYVSILHKNVEDPVERKIKEALEIKKLNPPINSKEEMKMAMRFISISIKA
ncbi:hypothetical protein V3C99_008620 [Haemonchus contortus]